MSHQASPGRARDPRSINELMSDALTDVKEIARHEKTLAAAEVRGSAVRGGVGAGLLAVTLVLLTFSVFPLLIALAELFVRAGMPRWGAYLLTWGVVVLLAVILAGAGALLLRTVRPPQRTITNARLTLAMITSRLGRGAPQPTAQDPTGTGSVGGASPGGSTSFSSSTVRA